MKTLKFASEIYWPLGTYTKLEWMELVYIESMTWKNQSTRLNRIINSRVLHTERSGLKRTLRKRNPEYTTKYYYIQKRARFEFDFFSFSKWGIGHVVQTKAKLFTAGDLPTYLTAPLK